MLVLGVYVVLLQYWGDGPLWSETGMDVDYCRNTWWKNILYVNNLVDEPMVSDVTGSLLV
jgi:hypothetical protein